MANPMLSGFPVIARVELNDEEQVVVVDRGESYDDRFVCGFHRFGEQEWSLGYYTPSRYAAMERMFARAGHD